MSQPEHGLTRQIRRHRGPLIGMLIVVLLALAAFVWWIGYEVQQSSGPDGPAAQVDGRTGEITETAPADPTAGTGDAPNAAGNTGGAVTTTAP